MLLALFFFLVVTPVGVAMRLVGRDPLRLKVRRAAATYWVDRRPPGPAPDSMKSQF